MVKKKKEEKLKKDFYTFQKKINRLEEIRREVNSLQSQGYAKGFEKEVSILKSRLKDVEALPELERNIKNLRLKIIKKREVKKSSPVKKLTKKVSDIGESVKKLEKKQTITAPINKIEKRVDTLGDSIRDVNFQIKKEIKDLKSSVDQGLNRKSKVDSSIGLVVDEQFQNFIHDIKLGLSEKLKFKEKELNDSLRRDISLRREELDSKYKEMESKLEKDYSNKLKEYDFMKEKLKHDYQKKVNINLKEEVSKRFNEELKKKFEDEKSKLDVYYVTGIKKKYQEEFENKKENLEKEFSEKISYELGIIHKKLDFEKKEQESIFHKKLKELNEKENVLIKKKKILENQLKNESDKEQKEVSMAVKGKELELKQRLNDIQEEKAKNEQILEEKLNEFEHKKIENSNNLMKEKEKLRKKLILEAHNELILEVQNYKKKLDVKLRSQLHNRMHQYLEEQKVKQEKELSLKMNGLQESLEREHKLNEELEQNVTEQKYDIEKLKERNRLLVEKQYQVKSQEASKFHNEKQLLIDEHKREIQTLTDRLRKNFNEKFHKELINKIYGERNKLSKEFDIKTTSEKEKLHLLSFNERRALQIKLKQEYNEKLKKNIDIIRKKLNLEVNRDFETDLNSRVLDERKKFEARLTDVERGYKEKEKELKLKEKELLDKHRKESLAIAEERKKFTDRIGLFKKENLDDYKEKEKELKLKEKDLLDKHKTEIQDFLEEKNKFNGYVELKEKHLLEEHKKASLEVANAKKTVSEELALLKKRNDSKLRYDELKLRKELTTRANIKLSKERNINQSLNLKALKIQDEKNSLIEQHKKDVQELTNSLKNDFNNKFRKTLSNNVLKEKTRLEKELDAKLFSEKEKLHVMSFNERRDFNRKLKQEYARKLKQNIANTTKKLQNHSNREFHIELNSRVLDERKKFEARLTDVERGYKEKEKKLKLKEKELIDQHMKESHSIVEERKKFTDRLGLFKKENLDDYKEKEKKLKLKEKELLDIHRKESLSIGEEKRKIDNILKMKEKELFEKHGKEKAHLSEERRKLMREMELIKKENESKIQDEKIVLKKKFAEEAHKQMLRELARREQVLNSVLQKKFEVRLKAHKESQEREISRRKAELAKELQSKAKALLG
ncbi:MAG: hypothetical protein AABX03_03190 [Nanoarchaeota archaeon]